MAIASGLAGTVLVGPVFTIIFENVHLQSNVKSCMRACVSINAFIFALLQLHRAVTRAVHNFVILGGQAC